MVMCVALCDVILIHCSCGRHGTCAPLAPSLADPGLPEEEEDHWGSPRTLQDQQGAYVCCQLGECGGWCTASVSSVCVVLGAQRC